MRRTIFSAALFLPVFGMGQVDWCHAEERYNWSARSEAYQRFNYLVQENKKNPSLMTRTVLYFPVVIHVVARAGQEPVSQAQALYQLDVLNADFAGKSENISTLLPEFSSLVADTEIRFCLASVDPDGFPTSGITYTQTDIADIALQTGPEGRYVIHWDQLGGKNGWDPVRYINIWVGDYGGILGSASFPGMAGFPEEIGLVMDIRHFGSIGEAGQSGIYGRGHSLTHEMGHFFGLKHIWGDGLEPNCNDGDDIDDTPNASGPYLNCPSGAQASCGTKDMYQNFMDLTDDRCLAAFTKGQAARMQSVIAVYYPDLGDDGSCKTYSHTFPDWYDELMWSHDRLSNRYTIYQTQGLMAQKRITVYSPDGKLILEDLWEDQLSYLLDLQTVAAGVYLVRIMLGTDSRVRKVVVF